MTNDRHFNEALDRHITGNWGEDQFDDMSDDPEDNGDAWNPATHLKTLKELRMYVFQEYDSVNSEPDKDGKYIVYEELRQEAIKWVKLIENTDWMDADKIQATPEHSLRWYYHEIYPATELMKDFFNITEADLK